MPVTPGLKAIKSEATGWREDQGGGHAAGRIMLDDKCMELAKDEKGGGMRWQGKTRSEGKWEQWGMEGAKPI